MRERFNQEEADAAFAWLRRLLPQVLGRGEKLAQEGVVKSWEWDREGSVLSASVQGGEAYFLTIAFERGRFQPSECTCAYGINCKHAAAAMFVAAQAVIPGLVRTSGQAVKGKAPMHEAPRADELLALVRGRAEKPLPAEATHVLSVVGTWWAARKRYVPIGEFLRLCGVQDYWAKGSVMLHAKGEPPRDAWDYLACVDAEATSRGGKLPAPLPNLIDRARQKELVEAMHREAAEKEWRDRIKGWARSMPENAPATRAELRLRFTATGADLEWKRPGQGEFAKMTTQALKGLISSGMPSAQEVLLTLGKNVWGAVVSFLSGDDGLRKAVLELLAMPQYRHVLAGASGAPLVVHEEPLRWDLKEQKDGSYALRLVDSAGVVAPEALFVTGKGPAWFVTTEAAWLLERWPFAEQRTGRHAMSIPASALESTEGVTVLHRLGVPLPAKIQEKVKSVPAKITVQARVHQPGEGRSSYVQVRARADFEGLAPCEWWVEHFWIKSGRSQGEDGTAREPGTILYFDKAPQASAAQWLGSFDLKIPPPGSPADAWAERRITKEFPEQFVQWMSARPAGMVVELDAELGSLRDGIVSGTVRLSVEEAGMDWFDLRVALDVADLTLTQEEIQLLLKAQGRWVRIEGKGWRKLEFTLTPEQEAELAAMGLAVGEFDGAAHRLHALQLAEGAGKAKGTLLPAERAEAVQRRAQEIQTRVQPEVPQAITAKLRPYQVEGFHFLAYLSANRFGGVLADDMGLGKTLQALAWVAWLRDGGDGEADRCVCAPVLVVCPKSVQDNWRSEAVRFYSELRVVVWTRDDAGASGLNGDADLVVIHYQQLRQHEERLKEQRWLAVILDEAQAIKNPTSQSARAACALQAEHRLALSGTPIENRLLDLWSIMGFAMPGVLGNRTHFAKHFDAKEDSLARRRLAARVRPFLLRRTKKEVARDLPDRVEEDLVCELEGTQQKLYQAELKRARAELLKVQTSKQLDKARFNILTSLLRLRQICCHPALVIKDGKFDDQGAVKKAKGKKAGTGGDSRVALNKVGDETGSAKLDALLELIEPIMEEGGKVLVFSQFVEMLEIVRAQIAAREWKHFVLTGQTDDRGALVKSFQESEGAAVFLISLKAGGFGLNLTAASYVVLVDPWWNPAVEAQAIDRTHRIGQTQKVNAYRLIVKDSIEEKIRMLQKQKSALAHDILGEENFASALSLADFRFLLGESD